MKVSVAIATYRGSRFVAEQLASIVSGSFQPDEIVVSDDASNDGTIEAVKDFALCSSVPIASHQQQENQGLIGNFESAIQATRGEIIFLSDQDDVWYPQKVTRVMEVFERDPAIGLVFSDAALVGQHLEPVGKTLWQSIGFDHAERTQVRSPFAFDLLLKRFLVTGATLAFRRSFLDVILPLPKHLIHDAWIALVISAVSRIECIDEPLIQYRQHAGQQIGEREIWRSWRTQWRAAKKMSPSYFHEQCLFFSRLVDRVERRESRWVHPGVGELARQKLLHLERRIAFREQRVRSLPAIASEFASGKYSKFSYGWKSAAQDVFL
jgi:glycosyltransferase involved in cell wall biosynthesis